MHVIEIYELAFLATFYACYKVISVGVVPEIHLYSVLFFIEKIQLDEP
jgi:hypothetical protein